MTIRLRGLASLSAFAFALTLPSAAQADYFVRPYLTLGAAVIDGIETNGATQRSESFTNDLQVNIDLADGTVKNYIKLTGPDSGGSGIAQAAGIMGDRVTFNGAEGTTVDFSFDFDGYLSAPARDPSYNSTLQLAVFANLYVFDADAGATYLNFSSLGGALVSQSLFLNYLNPAEPIDEFISRTLAGSVLVTGNSSFDVFASLSLSAIVGNNPATVEMDFLNTGTFGIQTAPGVSYTSDSGVFLTDQPPAVPEPATWAMLIGGFGLIGGAMRRREGAPALT